MSFYHLYIGDPDDPHFRWEGGDYGGNIPNVLLDLGSAGGVHGMVKAIQLLENPTYGGKQLDWGSTGTILEMQKIERFAREFYGEGPTLEYVLKQLSDLDGGHSYVLFACEE